MFAVGRFISATRRPIAGQTCEARLLIVFGQVSVCEAVLTGFRGQEAWLSGIQEVIECFLVLCF